jgi:hypothetical protein
VIGAFAYDSAQSKPGFPVDFPRRAASPEKWTEYSLSSIGKEIYEINE